MMKNRLNKGGSLSQRIGGRARQSTRAALAMTKQKPTKEQVRSAKRIKRDNDEARLKQTRHPSPDKQTQRTIEASNKSEVAPDTKRQQAESQQSDLSQAAMFEDPFNEGNQKVTDKDKGGRPKKYIDYKTLDGLCFIQSTGEECAAVLGMSYDTLTERLREDGYKGFPDYRKRHSGKGRVSLRRDQWQTAKNGSVTMQIWLGKQYLDQCDHREIEAVISSVEPEIKNFGLDQLDDDDLQLFKNLLEKQVERRRESESVIEGEVVYKQLEQGEK